MGNFCTNLHVRSSDSDQVAAAVRRAGARPAFISDAREGWLSVFPEASEDQDVNYLERLASILSRKCDASVFAFMVHDSDVFFYSLFEGGRSVDRYNSKPDYFEGRSSAPSGGDVAAVLKHCVDGTTSHAVEDLLHHKRPPSRPHVRAGAGLRARVITGVFNLVTTTAGAFEGDRLAEGMALLLGLERERATSGYRSLEDDPDATSSFTKV